MNVLVVGGTGFVGSHLSRELVERGHDVTVLARSPEDADLLPEVDRVAGDVTAYDSIEGAFEGQDAVVYLVALSPLFRPSGGEERHLEVHLGGTENAVRAAEAHGVGKYVQMSALGADPDGETHYIRAKGRADEVVRGSGLDWTIFRPSLLFGDGGEFIPFTKRLAPPYFTPLPGGGKTRFQPIWVGDMVKMLSMAAEGAAPRAEARESEVGPEVSRAEDDEEAPTPAGDAGGTAPPDPHVGQTYEIGGPEVLTLAEVARLGHAADNKPVNVYSVPMPLAGIGLKLLDSVPGAPMGSDQYRSLQFDNTTDDNDVDAFGFEESDLTTVAEYLGVDPAAVEPGRA